MPRRRRRKARRVQYEPHLVLNKVLNNDFLRTLAYVVYTAKLPIGAGAIAREVSRLLNKHYDHAYVSTYLRQLERWGVVVVIVAVTVSVTVLVCVVVTVTVSGAGIVVVIVLVSVTVTVDIDEPLGTGTVTVTSLIR